MEYPNKSIRFGNFPKSEQGRIIRLPVDQTPVIGQKKNKCGFFKSDIRLLMDASNNGDRAEFEKLANRLEVIPSSDFKKSIQQLFDEWQPLYLQTPSELQAWPAYLKSTHPDVYDRLYGADDRAYEASRSDVSNVDVDDTSDGVSKSE